MTYDDHRAALIQYLKAKVDICDWHGASDACCDLRELEAKYVAESVISGLPVQGDEIEIRGTRYLVTQRIEYSDGTDLTQVLVHVQRSPK